MRAAKYVIWPGLKLLGCVNTIKRAGRNSVLHTIDSCDETVKFVQLQDTFSYDQVRDLFRLSNCRTIASCQGTEFDDALTVWETNHPRFTLRHLFVALSRAKSKDLVQVA